MSFWITLPHAWKLQDVQAALNVVITVISGLGIFAFTRCCWQLGAYSVVRKNTVATSALLTLNTLGEVFETVVFLKADLMWHTKIFLQCCAVVTLTLMTLFSGPIARYSTRMTTATIMAEVDGILAARMDNSMPDSQVLWNLTQTSLDQAGFPLDQVLDYLPSASHAWLYRAEEWNNSWTMECESQEQTMVDLSLTSNCSSFTYKFGADTVRNEIFPRGRYSDYFSVVHGDYYTNGTYVQDLLLFMYAANYSDYEEDSDTYRTLGISIASLHAHGVVKNESDAAQDICIYGEGPAEFASYTRVSCSLTRANTVQDPEQVAFPDSGDVDNLPFALASNFLPRFNQESMSGQQISVITPRDLLRFYQTYTISKDTQKRHAVRRRMSVHVPAVEVASIFIAIFALLAMLIAMTLAVYGVFLLGYYKLLANVPQSKLDWLLHSIGPMTSVAQSSDGINPHSKVRLFEAAMYQVARGHVETAQVVQHIYHEPQKPNMHDLDEHWASVSAGGGPTKTVGA